MDKRESVNPSHRLTKSRTITRRKWSKIKDWVMIGVATLTFGTVIDNNMKIRQVNHSVPKIEQKRLRSPSVINHELKSIKDAYLGGRLDDKGLISWLEAINVDQNNLIATSCSPEHRHQLEALETDLKAAEALLACVESFLTLQILESVSSWKCYS